jgi:GTPase SAR1 family protein
MSKVIIVLGADRVGKSTLISSLYSHFSKDYTTECLHFSGPQPHHNSPIDQYLLELERVKTSELVLCDRGGAEVCFYEKYRRNHNIPIRWAKLFEKYLKDNFTSFQYVLLKREWAWCMSKHVSEIMALNPDCTSWWLDLQLEVRRSEHIAYYKYMNKYFGDHTKQHVMQITTNEFTPTVINSLFGPCLDE